MAECVIITAVAVFHGFGVEILEIWRRGTQKLHQFQTKSKLQLCTQCNPSPLFNIEGRGGAGESSVCCIKCYVEDVEQTPECICSMLALLSHEFLSSYITASE